MQESKKEQAGKNESSDGKNPKQAKEGFSPKLFLTQVNGEMKKVSWSTRQELINYTGVVGIAVAVVCALIWVCDTFFARLFHVILH